MTGLRGAAWCQERGIHRWRKVAVGIEQCAECDDTRIDELTPDVLAVYRPLLDELR